VHGGKSEISQVRNALDSGVGLDLDFLFAEKRC